jgi:hypothetical protein
VVAPVFQEYEAAPEAFSVVELPVQTVVVPDTVIAGDGLTVVVVVAVAVQPLDPVTVTV